MVVSSNLIGAEETFIMNRKEWIEYNNNFIMSTNYLLIFAVSQVYFAKRKRCTYTA